MPCREAVVVGHVASRNFKASLRNAIPSPKIISKLKANCQRILTRFSRKSLPLNNLAKDSPRADLAASHPRPQLTHLNINLAHLNTPPRLALPSMPRHFFLRHATLWPQAKTAHTRSQLSRPDSQPPASRAAAPLPTSHRSPRPDREQSSRRISPPGNAPRDRRQPGRSR